MADSLIYIRRQYLNAHLAARVDVSFHLCRVVERCRHKGRHKLYRIIIFQPCRLVRYHRISRGMGFVKGILGKIYHFIINPVCRLLLYPVKNAARNAFFFIAVDKALPLLLHDIALFFGHRAP